MDAHRRPRTPRRAGPGSAGARLAQPCPARHGLTTETIAKARRYSARSRVVAHSNSMRKTLGKSDQVR